MQYCDMIVIGHVSKDVIVTPEGTENSIGGAVVYSSIAAKRIGASVVALTKLAEADLPALDVFAAQGVLAICKPSPQSTSIRNTYLTADRERRTCEALGVAEPFMVADVPLDIRAKVYYLGGLMRGEFRESFVAEVSLAGKVALDAQGFVRVNEKGAMVFRDWPRKRNILPSLAYFKTDAAEAEILTGKSNIEEAARLLAAWGAREVMITHPGGVLVYAEGKTCQAPFTSRNLSGRTGRGDTCLSAYCIWRQQRGPEEACRFAAALTSLKMETPGPFAGTLADVEAVLRERYGA